jgi:uncharacterized protein YceK
MDFRHPFLFSMTGLLMCACSTMSSAPHVSRTSPKYFTGTRLNVAAISNDAYTLEKFERYGMKPAPYPIADLPLSAASDLVLLPYIVGCAIEPLGPTFGCYSGP